MNGPSGAGVPAYLRETARQAAEEWVWVPPDAEQRLTVDYHLVRYPERFTAATVVGWCRSARPAGELIAEIADQVRAWGRDEVSFWVSEGTRPADLAAALVRAGAELVESVDVLAADLAQHLPAMQSWSGTVRRVSTLADLRAAERLSARVFGEADPHEDELEVRMAALGRGESPTEIRVLALVGEEPVATGGCTVTGGIGRLWGGSTLAEHRGRGAYRAVLAERLRLAAEQGANLALVKGLTHTSSPILRRLGFEYVGTEHRYRLPMEPVLR